MKKLLVAVLTAVSFALDLAAKIAEPLRNGEVFVRVPMKFLGIPIPFFRRTYRLSLAEGAA